MVTSVRQLLLVLTFLVGLCAGLYLGAVVREGHAQTAEVASALNHAADRYGVPRSCLWNIARRETGGTFWPWVTNQRSRAAGLMQFLEGTYRFMSVRAGFAGTSPYDPWSAAHVAAWAISHPVESQGGLRHWGGRC